MAHEALELLGVPAEVRLVAGADRAEGLGGTSGRSAALTTLRYSRLKESGWPGKTRPRGLGTLCCRLPLGERPGGGGGGGVEDSVTGPRLRLYFDAPGVPSALDGVGGRVGAERRQAVRFGFQNDGRFGPQANRDCAGIRSASRGVQGSHGGGVAVRDPI